MEGSRTVLFLKKCFVFLCNFFCKLAKKILHKKPVECAEGTKAYSYQQKFNYTKKTAYVARRKMEAFSPIEKFGTDCVFRFDKEVQELLQDRFAECSLPEDADEDAILKWATKVSDFMFEIYMLCENKRITATNKDKIVSVFGKELSKRGVSLIDSDEYNRKIQFAIEVFPRSDIKEISIKEKVSFGFSYKGTILKKQEVIIYKPIN